MAADRFHLIGQLPAQVSHIHRSRAENRLFSLLLQLDKVGVAHQAEHPIHALGGNGQVLVIFTIFLLPDDRCEQLEGGGEISHLFAQLFQ